MSQDEILSIAPLAYGIIEAIKAYDNAYKKASLVYKDLTGIEAPVSEDVLFKAISLLLSEVKKSELNVEEFIKKYKDMERVFRFARRFFKS